MGQQSSHVDLDASGTRQGADQVGAKTSVAGPQAENGSNAEGTSQPQRSRVDKIFRRAQSSLNTRIKGRDRSNSPGNARSSKAAKQALRSSPRDSEREVTPKDGELIGLVGSKDSDEQLDKGRLAEGESSRSEARSLKDCAKTSSSNGEDGNSLVLSQDQGTPKLSQSVEGFSPEMGNLNTGKCFAPSRLTFSPDNANGHGSVKGRGHHGQKGAATAGAGTLLMSQEPRPPEMGSYLTVAPLASSSDMGLSPIDEVIEAPANYATGQSKGRSESSKTVGNAHRKEEKNTSKAVEPSVHVPAVGVQEKGQMRPAQLHPTGNTSALSLDLQKHDISRDGLLNSLSSNGSAVASPEVFADAASVVTDKSPGESPYLSAAESGTNGMDESPEMVDESQRTSSQTLTPSDGDDMGSPLQKGKSVSLDQLDNAETSASRSPRGHRATDARHSVATAHLLPSSETSPAAKRSHVESATVKNRKVGQSFETGTHKQTSPNGCTTRTPRKDTHTVTRHCISLEAGIESMTDAGLKLEEELVRPRDFSQDSRKSEVFQLYDDGRSERIDSDMPVESATLDRDGFRGTKTGAQSKRRHRYSSDSSYQAGDSDQVDMARSFKTASRTFSQLSLDEVVAVPKTVPEKLDFRQLEKFEGKSFLC